MQIAVIANQSANGRYRTILPLREMALRGHAVHWPGDRSFDVLAEGRAPSNWDALHVQQISGPEALALIARMRRAGVAVVWDTDDDIGALTRGSEAWHRLGGRRGVRRQFKQSVAAARAAHVMTTTNEHLAQVYREAGVERVVAIENYLGPEDLRHQRARHQGVVVGIAAASEHESDLRKLQFSAMLETLLERHDGVRVVGADLRMKHHRYTFVRPVEIERLIPTESQFDIALAPLRDTAFNRARSNVKLKEYGAAGAMWLASPVGPYVGMGEEQGGLLVGDDEWLSALEALLDDPDRRRALAARARRWAEGQTIRAGAARWQATFREAVERARDGA